MSDITAEGYSWTPQVGIRQGGLKCEGVVSPPNKLSGSEAWIYDAIIIGAGYAGLCAARDLLIAGAHSNPQLPYIGVFLGKY